MSYATKYPVRVETALRVVQELQPAIFLHDQNGHPMRDMTPQERRCYETSLVTLSQFVAGESDCLIVRDLTADDNQRRFAMEVHDAVIHTIYDRAQKAKRAIAAKKRRQDKKKQEGG